MSLLLELYWCFFKIGLFTVGGGLAALPLIQTQVVGEHGWLTLTEFTDLVTIAEMTPGPIGINAATFVGTRLAGVLGAVVATLGCITGPCVIVSIFAYIYNKYSNLDIIQGILSGLRPAVIAMIASACLSIVVLAFWGEGGFSLRFGDLNLISVALFAVALVLLRWKKPSPILVMAGCGVLGGAVYLLTGAAH